MTRNITKIIRQDSLDELRQEYEDMPGRNSIVRTDFDTEPAAYARLLDPPDIENNRHLWHIVRSLNGHAVDTANNYIINYNNALRITSGYRCPIANQRLESRGASPTSNHQYGRAFDFNQQDSLENYNAFDAAVDMGGARGDSYLRASNGQSYNWRTNPPPLPDQLPLGVTYIQGHVAW